jgi:hypothetical protein
LLREGKAPSSRPPSLAGRWAQRWEQRETALRALVARWREPASARGVLPNEIRDRDRAKFAAELEAVLDA